MTGKASLRTCKRVVDDGAGRWFPHGAVEPAPIPLDTFLFKVASRCNLACTYCYVYELEDQGWRSQPRFMSAATHKAALERIRDHVIAHALPGVTVIFHGGEPLLVGPHGLDELASRTRDRLGSVTEVRLGLQTNGTLFDERFLEVVLRHGMRVGLSIDGPPRHHDRFRSHPNGRGSSQLVERSALLLRDNPDAFGGILCVVNLDIEPAEVWDYLCTLQPKSIDLLLPLATYDHPPPGMASPGEAVAYGEWLVRFLELWYRAGEDRPDVRYFSSIMRLLWPSSTPCAASSNWRALSLPPIANWTPPGASFARPARVLCPCCAARDCCCGSTSADTWCCEASIVRFPSGMSGIICSTFIAWPRPRLVPTAGHGRRASGWMGTGGSFCRDLACSCRSAAHMPANGCVWRRTAGR